MPEPNAGGPSHWQSLAKAFSWRIVATVTTAAIAYVITGEIDTALLIGGIEFFSENRHLLRPRTVVALADVIL